MVSKQNDRLNGKLGENYAKWKRYIRKQSRRPTKEEKEKANEET